MERVIEKAQSLLKEWKGNSYTFGFDVLDRVGRLRGPLWKEGPADGRRSGRGLDGGDPGKRSPIP